MGEIKITDIKDQRLRDFATSLDNDAQRGGNANGVIDGNEVSVFGNLDLNKKAYTGKEYTAEAKEEHAKIMQELGLELTTAPQTEEVDEINSVENNNAAVDASEKEDKTELLELAKKGNIVAQELCERDGLQYEAVQSAAAASKTQQKLSPLHQVVRNVGQQILAEQEAEKAATPDATIASSEKASKNSRKWVKNRAKGARKQYISLKSFKDDIIAQANSTKTPDRKSSWNDALYALKAIPEVKTRQDVENLEKTMEKTLKAQGRWNDVTKEIAKQAKEVAKNELIDKEEKDLLVKFNEKMAKETDSSLHFKKYIKEIEKELGDTKGTYKKEALKELEEYAKALSESLRSDEADANYYTNTKAIQDKRPKKLDSDYGKTDYVKKKEKRYEVMTEHQKRVEASKHVTMKEIREKLDDKLTEKLSEYIYAHSNGDGTYDISGLATDSVHGIDISVGSDAKTIINKNDPELDERTWVADGLEAMMPVEGVKFDNGDVEKLYKYFGIELTKKSRNFGKAVLKNIVPATIAGLSGFTWGVTADQKMHLHIDAGVNQEAIQGMLDEFSQTGASVTNALDGSIDIKAHQFKDLRALQGLLTGGTTLLAGICIDMIFGMDVQEKTCFNVDRARKYEDLQGLKAFAHRHYSPDKSEAIAMLAELFIKAVGDEKEGLRTFYAVMDKVKGQGSVMTEDECLIAKGEILKALEELEDANKTRPGNSECLYDFEEKEEPVLVEENVATFDNRPDKKAGKEEYKWGDIARIYSCLDGYNEKTRARFMKIMQAITDGNYDFTRIMELTKQSLKDGRAQTSLKNIEGFDYDTFMDFYNNGARVGDSEYKVIAPEKLTTEGGNDCVRDDSRIGKASKIVVKKGRKGPNVTTNATRTTTTKSYSWTGFDCDGNVDKTGTDKESLEAWKQGKKLKPKSK